MLSNIILTLILSLFLRYSNLGENDFPELPTEGLSNLKHLKTYHNKELQDFPAPEVFPKIRFLTLSYAYHCCEFIESPEEVICQPELHL